MPEPAADGDRRGSDGAFVQSLERGLLVIRALDDPAPRTLSDVARATGLSRAAARRFLLTLEQLGYVRQADGRFALTPRVLELGYAYLSSLSLPELAQPHLRGLVEAVQESSSVAVLDGDDIVYVAREPTQRIMSVRISVGTRFPAFATSMGRVLLAALPDDDAERRLTRAERPALTARTLTAVDDLRAELARVRRQGFAIVDEELEAGLRSVAVPVHDAGGAVVAAVNLSVQASRIPVRDIKQRLVGPLRDTAAAIERDLRSGGMPPASRDRDDVEDLTSAAAAATESGDMSCSHDRMGRRARPAARRS